MAVLDKYTEFKIAEKEYKLLFTIRAVIQLEKRLDRKSILDTLATAPLSYSDTFEFFRWGLTGADKTVTEEKAEEIMEAYLEENNLGELQTLILEALMKSGVVGKVEVKND